MRKTDIVENNDSSLTDNAIIAKTPAQKSVTRLLNVTILIQFQIFTIVSDTANFFFLLLIIAAIIVARIDPSTAGIKQQTVPKQI